MSISFLEYILGSILKGQRWAGGEEFGGVNISLPGSQLGSTLRGEAYSVELNASASILFGLEPGNGLSGPKYNQQNARICFRVRLTYNIDSTSTSPVCIAE